MVVFPSSLTEEEEALQKKYAKLKKKVSKPNGRLRSRTGRTGITIVSVESAVFIPQLWSVWLRWLRFFFFFGVFSEKGASCLEEAEFDQPDKPERLETK